MELKDFISGTIQQIIDGVNEAIEYGKDHDADVNPSGYMQFGDESPFARKDVVDRRTNKKSTEYAQVIDFDVGVSTTKSGEVTSQAGIFVVPFFGGVKAKGDKSSIAVNRIQFSIPVILPKRKLSN